MVASSHDGGDARVWAAERCFSAWAAARGLPLEGALRISRKQPVIGVTEMKRQNIEVVLGFLDAIRRRDRDAAADFLHPETVWQGVVPDLVCRSSGEVLDIFFGRRDGQIEVERLELIGAEGGAIFAVHRPEIWEVAGVEIRGAMYHAVDIEYGRITRINDYVERADALAAVGIGDD
jgi:ketosteroid isomerase-like protein